ncbi:MAG: hypothetical protein AAB413_03980 [Patescibacteria group bacterium]
MKNAFLPLSLLSLVLIGGGCFNAVTETAIERGIESETGGSSDISLPDDFPTDFFVYDGDITIISAANIPDEGVSLMFSSEDSLSVVAAWYEAELTNEGWVKSQDYTLQGSVVQAYTKADLMTAVSLSETSGVTTGTIVRSQQE